MQFCHYFEKICFPAADAQCLFIYLENFVVDVSIHTVYSSSWSYYTVCFYLQTLLGFSQ